MTTSSISAGFLASLLFGGHISETIARHTYRAFCRHRLTTPHDILSAGWDFLVNPIMREGGYVGYDFSKSDQILRDGQTLVDEYGGSVWQVHEALATRTISNSACSPFMALARSPQTSSCGS